MINRKYLPLGSVVLLTGGKKRLMVYGRKQIDPETKKIYDYAGCLYPEGNITASTMFLFNANQIERVFFLGLQDSEEETFYKKNLE